MTLYFLFKSLHFIALISWMAGMFYLPRLYVYHCQATPGSELDETLKVMEYKLLRIIINPAMIATFIFGFSLAYVVGFSNLTGWFHAKLLMLVLMTTIHGLLARDRKRFAKGENKKSHKYYRILNEIPVVLMIVIVFLAVFKPF
jgi:protoporphyrinogen IX oxidase